MIVEFLVLQFFHTKLIKIKWNHHRMKVEIVQSSEFCKKKINNALLYNLHCFEDSLTYCCKASGDPIRTEDVDRALLWGFQDPYQHNQLAVHVCGVLGDVTPRGISFIQGEL